MHRPKSIIAMSIFVLLLQWAMTLVHFFIYYSIIQFVRIPEDWIIGFGLFMWGLSLTFFASTLAASRWDNRKTRYAYYVSSIWLGIVHFLSLACFFVWIVVGVSAFFDIMLPYWFIAETSFIVALLASLYSIYHARQMQLTRVSVQIRDLPMSWQGKKIALISDVHIGHINRAKFLREVVKKINAENVELLCIAGDLFDGMDGRLEHLLDPLNQISAKHGIVYADGNHETYLGVERAFRALSHTKTRILRDEIVTLDGLDVIGIDYPEPGERKDIAKAILSLRDYKKENPSILLYHTPFQISNIAKTGVNLELCGHTHKWQLWPYGIITYFLFKGRDYGLSHIGDYTLYTSSGVGTWWPPMRIWTKSEIVVITLENKK